MTTNITTHHNTQLPTAVTVNLLAGGGAGIMEAFVCHPLDTIKVRMQLVQRDKVPGIKSLGFIGTGADIARTESISGLYRGLGAVIGGIVPKMAIRFTSFEQCKQLLRDKDTSQISRKCTFIAGLVAGLTEAVTMVTPMEVVKIRLQSQQRNLNGSYRYRSAVQTLLKVLMEEGIHALWRGVSLTALRQGSNQAANFTTYTELKTILQRYQAKEELPACQTTLIGLLSGSIGPFFNAPVDMVKTRLQQTPAERHQSTLTRIIAISKEVLKLDGLCGFYKGITPRVVRVAPGQAVTFTVYEFLKRNLEMP